MNGIGPCRITMGAGLPGDRLQEDPFGGILRVADNAAEATLRRLPKEHCTAARENSRD